MALLRHSRHVATAVCNLHFTPLASVQWVVRIVRLVPCRLCSSSGSRGFLLDGARSSQLVFALSAVLHHVRLLADIPMVDFARASPWVGGALLVPGSLSLISANCPRWANRVRAIGTLSRGSLLTRIAGARSGRMVLQTWLPRRWVLCHQCA